MPSLFIVPAASFDIAWLVLTLVARLLFGSGNVLGWVLAGIVGVGVYIEVLQRDRRVGWLDGSLSAR